MTEAVLTVDEKYATACTTSNLGVDTVNPDKQGQGDVIVAAGWSHSRVGQALMRLHTEWDATSRLPLALGKDAINRLALEFGRKLGEQAHQVAYAELRATGISHGEALERLSAAKPNPAMAKAAADQWRVHELKLKLQRLKTLPELRAQIIAQCLRWEFHDPENVAIAVLTWKLAPLCPVCNGTRFQVIQGTGRQSNKVCRLCHGSGEARLPYGEAGKKLANWLDDCIAVGKRSLIKRLRR